MFVWYVGIVWLGGWNIGCWGFVGLLWWFDMENGFRFCCILGKIVVLELVFRLLKLVFCCCFCLFIGVVVVDVCVIGLGSGSWFSFVWGCVWVCFIVGVCLC